MYIYAYGYGLLVCGGREGGREGGCSLTSLAEGHDADSGMDLVGVHLWGGADGVVPLERGGGEEEGEGREFQSTLTLTIKSSTYKTSIISFIENIIIIIQWNLR